MKNRKLDTDYFSTSWEWEEEIFNEETDEYETKECYAEVEVEVFHLAATGPSYHCAGEPEEWSFEIKVIEGDEIPDHIEDDILKWAVKGY
jgi:hypothetical protein